jgi:ferredoxin-NADP reductase
MSQTESNKSLTHDMRLTSIRYLSGQINLYEISPLENAPVPEFSAGSHVDVHLPNGIVRQYSLVNEGEQHRYLIGVKLDRQSRGGSRYMHDDLRVGAVLKISSPRNNFPLAEDATHSVLIAGGIGITPIAAMAKRLEQIGKSWELHYAVRTRDEACFLEGLNQAKVHLHVDVEHQNAPMNISGILAKTPSDAHVYCCGPGPMLDVFESCAQGRPADNIHIERFAAVHVDAEPSVKGYTIKLNKSGLEFTVQPGQTMLEVLRGHGIEVSTSCEQGICGSCETRVLAGIPEHRDSLLSASEKASNKVIMVCCSGSKSDLLVLDL